MSMQCNYILKTLKFTIYLVVSPSRATITLELVAAEMTNRRLLEARNSTWQISLQNVISSFLILILLFVSYF